MADSRRCCPFCGAPDLGLFCMGCGMKFAPDGAPAFTREQLQQAVAGGEAAVVQLASSAGLSPERVMRVARMAESAGARPPSLASPASSDRVTNPSLHPVPPESAAPSVGMPDIGMPDIGMPNIGMPNIGMPNVGAPNLGSSGLFRRPQAGLHRGPEPVPRLMFGYDDSFYQNTSGQIILALVLEGSTGTEQDIKLTLEGDLDKPQSVNFQDRLGQDVRCVVTPTVFPVSKLVFHLSWFDQFQEAHCAIGESCINDVVRHLDQAQGPHISITQTGDVGDKAINLAGADASSTMHRRRLDKAVREQVSLREDDEAERRLSASSKADRIKAGELLVKARRRVEKCQYEGAYQVILEVEKLGFNLREVQSLRTTVERELSQQAYDRGRQLWGQGKVPEARQHLMLRKDLCLNQEIIELLADIEDLEEACKRAQAALDGGDLDEAEARARSAEAACALWDVVKALRQKVDAERDRRRHTAEQELLARARSAEEEVRCRERAAARQAQAVALRAAVAKGAFGEAFALLESMAGDPEHDRAVVDEAVAGYVKATGLRRLAKFMGTGEGDPHELLVAEPEAPVGRQNTNLVALSDSTSRTGRSHGLIRFEEKTRSWFMLRVRGKQTGRVGPISINKEQLSEDEAWQLTHDDVISFADVVKVRAHVPEPLDGPAVRLSYEQLPPEDQDLKDLVHWTLFTASVLVGGAPECHVHLQGVAGVAFVLACERGIFWARPSPKPGAEPVTVSGRPLVKPVPLYHEARVTVGGRAFTFFQLRTPEELLQYDDELAKRGLPPGAAAS